MSAPSALPQSCTDISLHQHAANLYITYSLDDDTGDAVRVGVGSGSAVLKVTHLLVVALAVDTHRGTTVGDTPGELVKRRSLVGTRHAELVIVAIHLHVLLVAGAELLHGRLDGLVATLLAHLLGRHVGVKTGAVPVTRDGLGGESDLDAKLLGDAVEDEARHPELIGNCSHVRSMLHRSTHLGHDSRSMPLQGPTWYSHWAGMTSALVPEMLMPA